MPFGGMHAARAGALVDWKRKQRGAASYHCTLATTFSVCMLSGAAGSGAGAVQECTICCQIYRACHTTARRKQAAGLDTTHHGFQPDSRSQDTCISVQELRMHSCSPCRCTLATARQTAAPTKFPSTRARYAANFVAEAVDCILWRYPSSAHASCHRMSSTSRHLCVCTRRHQRMATQHMRGLQCSCWALLFLNPQHRYMLAA
jgi:hypothetical protein